MITVTKLRGGSITLNSDLIETVESTPDTVVTMTTGHKMLVRESPDEIIRLVVEFRRSIANRPEGR